jgi:hypothetical protein
MSFDALGKPPMGNVDEYRRSAASLLDLAQRTDSVADKNRFLVMAEAWLALATRAAKTPMFGHDSEMGFDRRNMKHHPRQAANTENDQARARRPGSSSK